MPCSGQVPVLYRLKGGYLDFSHLTELVNMYITEIYRKKKKQYKSSRIKNHKKHIFFKWYSHKRLRGLLS